jgi:hypothetical protein
MGSDGKGDRFGAQDLKSALSVAARAARADRPELARELLAVALRTWQEVLTRLDQEPAIAELLLQIAAADLQARGKL